MVNPKHDNPYTVNVIFSHSVSRMRPDTASLVRMSLPIDAASLSSFIIGDTASITSTLPSTHSPGHGVESYLGSQITPPMSLTTDASPQQGSPNLGDSGWGVRKEESWVSDASRSPFHAFPVSLSQMAPPLTLLLHTTFKRETQQQQHHEALDLN